MAISDTIHVGDVGIVFTITIVDADSVAVDISGATDKVLFFRKPSRTRVRQAAEFVTDGTDGQLQYTTVAGDIDEAGSWQVQGY